jgi:hypothetical protein
VTGFGDFVRGADSHDDAPPDPVAVARILLDLLRARIPGGFRRFDQHTPAEQAAWVDALTVLLARLHDEGPG